MNRLSMCDDYDKGSILEMIISQLAVIGISIIEFVIFYYILKG